MASMWVHLHPSSFLNSFYLKVSERQNDSASQGTKKGIWSFEQRCVCESVSGCARTCESSARVITSPGFIVSKKTASQIGKWLAGYLGGTKGHPTKPSLSKIQENVVALRIILKPKSLTLQFNVKLYLAFSNKVWKLNFTERNSV